MVRELFLSAALAALAAPAFASVTVERGDGQPLEAGDATIALNPITGGWDVTLSALYAPGGETEYIVRGNGGEVIDNVFIDVPCWQGPDGSCVPAGSPVFVRVLSEGPLGIQTVHNVEQRSDAEVFLLDVQANSDVGAVRAHVVGTVFAGRDVIGPVVGTVASASNGVFWVEAHRDVRGDVLAENGRIGLVWAYRNVGLPGAPVNIHAQHKINGVYTGTVAMLLDYFDGAPLTNAGAVNAHINARVNGGNGYLFACLARSFDGTIEMGSMVNDGGTGLPGRVAVTDSFDGTLIVGGLLGDPQHWIELPAQGIEGQIIINADNVPGDAWVTPIYFGSPTDPDSTMITDPNYPLPAQSIGGGSIGVVPFALHGPSCDPPSGSTAEPGTAKAPRVVRLRHYGPVAVDGPAPLIIDRRPAGAGGSFAPVSLTQFSISVDPADANSILVGPAEAAAGFASGYEYRIVATPELLCNVSDLPPVAWMGDYRVTIQATGCPADLNGDGMVNMTDILVLIALWGPAGGPDGDLDGSGHVDFADLLLLFGQWGPCA